MKAPKQWMFTESYSDPASRPALRLVWDAVCRLGSGLRFFASLKLAIVVLGSLMVVLAAGTIIESTHGAEAAKILVYDTFWFGALLVLLGINVLGAALDRIPWRKKHTGFVMTHCGILIILAGAFITRHFMIDGQMPVAEGQTESAITLSEPVVYAFSENPHQEGLYAIPKKALPWHGRLKIRKGELGAPLELEMLSYYPKARAYESVTASETGPAALEVTLHNSFVNETRWLLESPASRSDLSLGPARLVFAGELLKENTEAPARAGYLEFAFEDGSRFEIPVPESAGMPVAVPLGASPFRVSFVRVLKNAVVAGRELRDEPLPEAAPDNPASWKNPAVELVVEGGGFRENHTVFARFPDFPTVHGMKPSRAKMRILYHLPDMGSQGGGRELRFVKDAEGGLQYQVKKGLEVRTGRVVAGEDIETGWMDLKFRVEAWHPHAQLTYRLEPQPNLSEAEDLTTAVEVEARAQGEAKRLWLRQGYRETLSLGGRDYQMIFGQRKTPLGFKLQLKDFKIEHNPGTSQPASFSSDVIMKDDTRGKVVEQTISMNKPLEYRGFKIYQAAYSLVPGEPEVSIFSVGRDPGIPVKYAGALVMIGGIITMFSMRKLYQKKV